MFESPNSDPVSWTQLRTGSFDYLDAAKTDKAKNILKTPLPAPELSKEDTKKIAEWVNKGDIPKDYIDSIRGGEDIDALNKLIVMIGAFLNTAKLPPASRTYWDKEVNKFKNELTDMRRDQMVIEVNKKCIEGVLGKANENPDSFGLKLPTQIRAVLNTDSDFKDETKQNWGMISLQTPMKIKESQRKAIASRFIDNPLMPAKLKKYITMLLGDDMSELDAVDRERRAFASVVKDKKLINHGLYFNIATNTVGATYKVPNTPISIQIGNFFNTSCVAKAKKKRAEEMTDKSTETLYALANKALEMVQAKMKVSSKPEDQQVYERYCNSLKDLIDETFEVKAGEKVKLKMNPSNKASYEVVGRLTVLMDMLGFKTTGHCRSGNNRTASWLAKTHQIVGDMAASADGHLTEAKVMAGALADKSQKDHWSLGVFLHCFKTSLTLQAANKGTMGTKIDVKEVPNKVLRKALFKGAFDLAGPLDTKMLGEQRMKELKGKMDALRETKSTGLFKKTRKIKSDVSSNDLKNVLKLIAYAWFQGDEKDKKVCVEYVKELQGRLLPLKAFSSASNVDSASTDTDEIRTSFKDMEKLFHDKKTDSIYLKEIKILELEKNDIAQTKALQDKMTEAKASIKAKSFSPEKDLKPLLDLIKKSWVGGGENAKRICKNSVIELELMLVDDISKDEIEKLKTALDLNTDEIE